MFNVIQFFYFKFQKQLLMFSKLSLIILIISCAGSYAQSTGSLSGVVTDKTTNETLIGASVVIAGTTLGATTDIDGVYSIKNLAAGTYSLKVSYVSYQTLTVEKVEVKGGQDSKLNIAISPSSQELQEVVITSEALKTSETSVLKIQKNSLNIMDGVSAELISKNNSSDGTDVLKRMTGVTISEGKYAFIRGVGDRYNNTLLNGANLPSTDPEKKSFSYDIFPASLIENVLTSKTFTPDKPADFSGGLVEINTVEFPDHFILDVSTSSNYDTKTSFKNMLSYNGGGKDWLGYDDGTRNYPSMIDQRKVGRGNYSTDELKNIGLAFANNWQTLSKNAPVNGSFKINTGNKYNLSGSDIVGYIASLTYSNSTSARDIERNNYTFEGPRFLYNGSDYTNSVSLGALLNVSYKFAQNHKISFKNIFNENSDNETTFYQGDYFYNPDYRKVTSLRYISRSLYSSQVIGDHHLEFFNGLDIGWNLNYAYSKRNEPDARRYVYIKDQNNPTTESYIFSLDQSISTRFYGDLNDYNRGAGTDFTLKLF